MIAWINLVTLILSTVLTLYFYVKSAGPAALEKRIGEAAYRKCAQYRVISSVFMTLASINYVIYAFYPLPLLLARTFPWPWRVSALIAVVIVIPSGYLFFRGMKDAGEETMTPKKEHAMYGGVYERIRHPQAVGELPFWWVFAFLCHSPFLVLYSFVWVPIFYWMCLAEEKDLVLRYGDKYGAYRERTGFLFPRSKSQS